MEDTNKQGLIEAVAAPLNAVQIINPVSDEVQQQLIKAAYATAQRLRDAYDSVPRDAEGKVTDKKLLQELKKAVKAADDDAKDFPKAVAEGLIRLVGLEALATQLEIRQGRSWDPQCVRGRLSALAKEIDEDLEALKVPEPTHTYLIQVECSDAALKKILKACDGAGGKYRYAAPQSDRDFKAVEKFFTANAEAK